MVVWMLMLKVKLQFRPVRIRDRWYGWYGWYARFLQDIKRSCARTFHISCHNVTAKLEASDG